MRAFLLDSDLYLFFKFYVEFDGSQISGHFGVEFSRTVYSIDLLPFMGVSAMLKASSNKLNIFTRQHLNLKHYCFNVFWRRSVSIVTFFMSKEHTFRCLVKEDSAHWSRAWGSELQEVGEEGRTRGDRSGKMNVFTLCECQVLKSGALVLASNCPWCCQSY